MQNYKLNGIKRKLSILTVAFTFMLVLCHASEFPLAGGNIASSETDGWNGAKPGSGEDAAFSHPGIYWASDNVTFGSVNFATDGLVFDLSSGNRAVTLDGATPVVGPTIANATTHLKGGSWNGKDITFKSIGAGYTLRLTDGASIADAGTLSLGHGLINNSVVLDSEAKIQAGTILLHRWGNTGTKLDVGGGSKVYATGAFMVQQNGDSGIYFAGNHFVDVHDAGSLLQVGGDLNLGQNNSDNVVRIRDGATLFVNSTARMAGGGRHLLEVLNGATATVKKTEISTVGNRIVVSNATYKVSEVISLGNAATVTGNVMIVTGPEAVFNWAGNVFGTGCGNVFELTDRATWDMGGAGNYTLMGGSSSNILRVVGGSVLSNTNFPSGAVRIEIGVNNTTHGHNRIEIIDGAMVNLEGFFVHGVNNEVIVSNATLKIDGTGYGIWLGRGSSSSGNKLIIQGATPSVYLKEYKSVNGSVLRFEVPAEGYAEGYVPVTTKLASNLDTATEKFEIDCAVWAANPNAVRKLVLMRTTTDITPAQVDWILAQNSDLPDTVRLKVTMREVILQKRVGFVLSFR